MHSFLFWLCLTINAPDCHWSQHIMRTGRNTPLTCHSTLEWFLLLVNFMAIAVAKCRTLKAPFDQVKLPLTWYDIYDVWSCFRHRMITLWSQYPHDVYRYNRWSIIMILKKTQKQKTKQNNKNNKTTTTTKYMKSSNTLLLTYSLE